SSVRFTLFPYTTLFRSRGGAKVHINSDSVLEIDRKKTFVIGFIMPPLPDAKTPDGRNGIDELHDAGATFLRTGIIGPQSKWDDRSEEHTSELQSPDHLV